MRPRSSLYVSPVALHLRGITLTLHQHKTIESVLQRGEKINDLVDRSNELSMQSKMFYKTAKKVCPCPPSSSFISDT